MDGILRDFFGPRHDSRYYGPNGPHRDQGDFGFPGNGNPFEQMMREAEDMLRTFGNMSDHSDRFNGALEEPRSSGHPRDLMLKVPESGTSGPLVRRDVDCDEQVARQGLGSVWETERPQERRTSSRPWFSSYSFSSSWSYSASTDGSNRKVEEYRKYKDSTGKREKTVSKTFGDKSYSVSKKKLASGGEEIDQHFLNMDEAQLEDFERQWSGHKIQRPVAPIEGDSERRVVAASKGKESKIKRWFDSLFTS